MSKIKQAIGITLFESDDFGGPKIVCGGICPTQRAEKVCCGVIEVTEMEIKLLGNLFGDDKGTGFAGNVWDKDHLSPTLNTMQGGCKQPMIIENISCTTSRVNKGEFASSQDLKLINVGQEEAGTILSRYWKGIEGDHSNAIIVAMLGRNPTNPSDRTPGIEIEQRLEPNTQGTSNCLTSVQKDNLVMESVNKVGQISNDGSQYGTVIADNGLSPNLVAGTHGYANSCIATQYRIRKLTPRECWGLMDFSDEDFEKAAEVNSNTQLYKQAGNSIVVNVLVAVLGQLFPGKENVYKELSE